jgi:hypothetical protein
VFSSLCLTLVLLCGADDRGPALELRLVPLADGPAERDAGTDGGNDIFRLAGSVQLDLRAPPHPLVAWECAGGRLFYLFYKTVEEAFGDRPYLIQRIRKTVREYTAPDDAHPRTTITCQVEAFRTIGGTLKRPDEHFARITLKDAYRIEVLKEYEIGFGEIPGVCTGTRWPGPEGKLYWMLQPYAPDPGLYDKVRFRLSRKWSLSVSLDRQGNYWIRSSELNIDLPDNPPPPEAARPRRDPASAGVVLVEGVGVGALRLKQSRAADVARAFGPPLEVVQAGAATKNYSHRRALTFNIYDNGAINTIFTRPGFAGRTRKGIRHGDERARVVELYGPAPGEPDDTCWFYREGVGFYFDSQGRVRQIVIRAPK